MSIDEIGAEAEKQYESEMQEMLPKEDAAASQEATGSAWRAGIASERSIN